MSPRRQIVLVWQIGPLMLLCIALCGSMLRAHGHGAFLGVLSFSLAGLHLRFPGIFLFPQESVKEAAMASFDLRVVPAWQRSRLLTFVPFGKRQLPELQLPLRTPRRVPGDYPI